MKGEHMHCKFVLGLLKWQILFEVLASWMRIPDAWMPHNHELILFGLCLRGYDIF
jgi:hypothetical protein